MDMQIAGLHVLITGASQGIGAALARAFAREGCRLTLVARSATKLDALAMELAQAHGLAPVVLAIDMTEPGAIERIAHRAPDVDVLVNNAGSIPGGNLWEVDSARWREGWALKVMGYIDMTRAYYPLMRARHGGVILNNIGAGGEIFDFDYVAGSTGNAALMAFTRTVGGKSLQDNIRVIGVNPGPVATERIEKILKNRAQATLGDAGRSNELLARLPRGRAATVEEIADMFVMLASPRSAYTSGVIVTIDGGMSSARSIT